MVHQTLIHRNQQEYYDAIMAATNAGSSTPFIEFMLGIIHEALVGVLEQQEGQAQPESNRMATVSNRLRQYGDDRDAMVVSFLSKQGCATVGDIAKLLGLSKDRTRAVLRDMAQRGLIVKVGAGRATRYELGKQIYSLDSRFSSARPTRQ